MHDTRRPWSTLRAIKHGGLFLLAFVAVSAGAGEAEPAKRPLGLAVDHDGRRAYVALYGAGRVAEVDLENGKVLREMAVDRGPWDVALVGRHLSVTCSEDDQVVRLALDEGRVTKRWAVWQGPRGLAVFPDESRWFAVCHDQQTLHAIEPATGRRAAVALPGWPERVILHRDSEYPYLLALSHLPGEARVSLVDSRLPPRVVAESKLTEVSNARSLASKPGATSFVIVPHQKPRTQVPATQVAQGWVFTNVVSTFSPWGVDTPKGATPSAKVLDDAARFFADPADIVLSPDFTHAFVACAGADTILMLRTDRFVSANYGPLSFDDGRSDHPKGKDDLALSRQYVVARFSTQENPRRLALSGDGRTLVVCNHLGDSLTVIDTVSREVKRHIPLGGPAPDALRRGEILFHSAGMTVQGQFTCASCHPDGGSDGLNWDLPRDGLGNFVQTRPLWGAADTLPYGWHGASPTLEDRVAGTLRTLQRHEPQGSEAADLAAYVKSLPPARPLPVNPSQQAAERRGQTLFAGKALCAACHRGPALADAVTHDVGTGLATDPQPRFDTPSLRGLGRTAPYLHHGQASTLEEVFSTFNSSHKHGSAHRLSAEEMADLITYLKSL